MAQCLRIMPVMTNIWIGTVFAHVITMFMAFMIKKMAGGVPAFHLETAQPGHMSKSVCKYTKSLYILFHMVYYLETKLNLINI